MIILFVYSLVRKLAVSVASRPDWVRKLKKFAVLSAQHLLFTTNIFSFNIDICTHQQASTYHLIIRLNKKQKQQLSYITAFSLKSCKY